MGGLTTGYGSDVGKRYSPAIWGRCPLEGIRNGTVDGWIFEEDFINTDDMVSGSTVDGWYSYFETAGTGVVRADVMGGIMRITSDATDKNLALCLGDNKHGLVEFNAALSSPKDLWFETRVAAGQIVEQSLFVGFLVTGEASTVDALADDGTGLGDVDYVGFEVLEAAPATVNAHAQKSGVAGADIVAGAHTLVADEFVKLGLKFVASENKVYVYANGVRVGSVLTSVANFPAGVEMTLAYLCKDHSTGGAGTWDIDCVRIAQLL